MVLVRTGYMAEEVLTVALLFFSSSDAPNNSGRAETIVRNI